MRSAIWRHEGCFLASPVSRGPAYTCSLPNSRGNLGLPRQSPAESSPLGASMRSIRQTSPTPLSADVTSDRPTGLRIGLPLAAYGGSALTNGRPGGNEPIGNLAKRSPAFSNSAASRNAARNRW